MSPLKYRMQPGTHTVEMLYEPVEQQMHIPDIGEQQMLIPEKVKQQWIIPKRTPFTRFINGDTEDFRDENIEWTAELNNSDAVNYDEQVQNVLLAASHVDDDKVRSGLLEMIPWMTKGATFTCFWHPIQGNTLDNRRENLNFTASTETSAALPFTNPDERTCPGRELPDGKLVLMHHDILSTELYMPVPKGKPFVRHINGNTLDNRRENLQWTSETSNSDAVLFDPETRKALLAASQIDDDDSRALVVKALFSLADINDEEEVSAQ